MYVPEHENIPEKEISTRLKELARLFLRLGATAFGGPAAQIAITQIVCKNDQHVGSLDGFRRCR